MISLYTVVPCLTMFIVQYTLAALPEATVNKKGRDTSRRLGTEKITLDMIRKRYGKKDPPLLDRPTEVKLGIYINSFYSISEQTMDYMVSMYLRQSWMDPRLKFNISENGNSNEIRLSEDSIEDIWVPDIFFRNEKSASFHEVTVSNRLLRLKSDGNLWYVTKISAKLACPMDLQKYPMDTQTCPMMFESFGYTMDTMYFSWLDHPVDIDKSVELPQFTLEKYKLYDCSQNYTAGAFPCKEIKFILRRDIGFFVIQVYIPSILIVILSWVSFWLNIEAAPARVSIGLLTVLTTTTQSSVRGSLPRVSYVKAIDVWMSTCLIFVFASLLEFAVVNVMLRQSDKLVKSASFGVDLYGTGSMSSQHLHQHQQHQQRLRRRAGGGAPGSAYCQSHASKARRKSCCAAGSDEDATSSVNIEVQMAVLENGREHHHVTPGLPAVGGSRSIDPEGKIKARKIDKISRKAFPLAFLLFNIIYWIIYTVPDAL